MNTISERTGAGLLLDINNVYVSAHNHGFDAGEYLAGISSRYVQEVHLAGHSVVTFPDGEIRIDDHASPVSDAVWSLFDESLQVIGEKPTLIEWDAQLPSLTRLVAEASTADGQIGASHALVA